MINDEMRLKIIDIMRTFGSKRINALKELKSSFQDDEILNFIVDGYLFYYKNYKKVEDIKALINSIENYQYDYQEEILLINLVGNLNMILKNYDKSEENYKQVINKDDNFLFSYLGLGNIYTNKNEFEEAKKWYQISLEKDTNFLHAYSGLGNIYSAQKKYDKAEEYFELAIKKSNEYIFAYNSLGIIFKNKKEYDKAEEWYLKAIAEDKDYVFTYNNIATLYRLQSEYKKAEKYYKIAIKKDSNFIYAYNGLAKLFYIQKNYKEAEKYYKHALNIDEDFSSIYNYLGIIYFDQNSYEKAEEYYLMSIEKDVDCSRSYTNLGILYLEWKMYEKSEEYLIYAIDKDIASFYTYNALGNLYVKLDEIDKAKKYYQLAINLSEGENNLASVYNNMGILYKNQGDFEKSEEYHMLSLEYDENYAIGYNNLGVLYKKRKEYLKSEEYYKMAIEKDIKYVIAYNNLGYLYREQNLFEKAEEYFNLAKQISEEEKSNLEASLSELELEKIKSIKNRILKQDGEKKSDFVKRTTHLFKSIEVRKNDFNKFITDDRNNEKHFKLEVLRRWNSYTPIIANNFHVSKGGGYFLNLNGHGCVVDPGFNFIDNFKGSGKCFRMIDSVIISHAHNDHESDLESILTLLYKYNEEIKCIDFHVSDDDYDTSKFEGTIRYDIAKRENISINDVSKEDIEKEFLVSPRRKIIDVYVPESVYKKYQGMLDLYGNNNYNFIQIKKDQDKVINGVKVNFIWAKHRDIISSEHSLGLYIVHEDKALIYTGDTGWSDEVQKYYEGVKDEIGEKDIILIAHLGGFKDKEENFKYENSKESECTYGNHLGRLGMVGINEVLKPKLCIVSEFGEEFKGSRREICEILNELFNGTYFLPADIGLSYNFKNDMIRAIHDFDSYKDIIEDKHYKEVPFNEVSAVLLRADYSLHYYHNKSCIVTDEITQALTKMYYTSPK